MGLLKEYNPKEVIISWDGVNMNEGIASGTFVTLARTTRTFSQNTGGDGGTTRVRSNDQSASVTVTLRAGSETNEKLSNRATDEELDPPTPHVAALLVQDFSGNTLHSAPQAYLDGPANDEFATEEGNREWVLLTPQLLMGHGGNKDAGA